MSRRRLGFEYRPQSALTFSRAVPWHGQRLLRPKRFISFRCVQGGSPTRGASVALQKLSGGGGVVEAACDEDWPPRDRGVNGANQLRAVLVRKGPTEKRVSQVVVGFDAALLEVSFAPNAARHHPPQGVSRNRTRHHVAVRFVARMKSYCAAFVR